MDHEALVRLALENGATKAQAIPQSKIVTNKSFWDICAGNGCGRFGKYWNCPPAIGEPDALIEKLHTYDFAVLYQTIGEIEDSFDIEGTQQMAGETFLHLANGGCDLCARCGKLDNIPCRFPDKVLAPMEGYCIDVYRTAKGTDLKYINGENTVTYFGIMLFKENENA